MRTANCLELTKKIQNIQKSVVDFDIEFQRGIGNPATSMELRDNIIVTSTMGENIIFTESEKSNIDKSLEFLKLPKFQKLLDENRIVFPDAREIAQANRKGFTKPLVIPSQFSMDDLIQNFNIGAREANLTGLVTLQSPGVREAMSSDFPKIEAEYYLIMMRPDLSLPKEYLKLSACTALWAVGEKSLKSKNLELKSLNLREYITLQAEHLMTYDKFLDDGIGCFLPSNFTLHNASDDTIRFRKYLIAQTMSGGDSIRLMLEDNNPKKATGIRVCTIPKKALTAKL
jgi:hypothetical protein